MQNREKSNLDWDRRSFLKSALATGLLCSLPRNTYSGLELPVKTGSSKVAFTHGEDQAENIYQAMSLFRNDLQHAIGDKLVVLKPNNVLIDNQLSATHRNCLEGILEFLKSIGKTRAVIAESAANGATLDGYENYGYPDLARRYSVDLIDLDREPLEILWVFDQGDFRPHPVRTSSILLDRDRNFLISVAKFKTHDRVVATLSLKNMVFGAPIKDVGFSWGGDRKPGTRSDKHIPHGSGFRAINYNIFHLAHRLSPSFAVIDGYRGMEGDGPILGSPVEHRVALAGFDWLATDRIALELMGIEFSQVGYLNFCAEAGMGQSDQEEIEILGDQIRNYTQPYRLNKNIEQQLIWMKPATVG
jgi:uncharacterized protein (DUF362 family)